MIEHIGILCLTLVILALLAHRGWMKLMDILSQAVEEFDLDEVEVVGRSVKVKGKK